MEHWEYTMVAVVAGADATAALNALGADGWRLILLNRAGDVDHYYLGRVGKGDR